MRLIVHIGLHKTGSTYLQHVMNDNHAAFRARGVHYEHQPGYPAHHFAAWDVLRGDASSVARMITEARLHGCHTAILSSEDLEGGMFDRTAAAAIEAAAEEAGADWLEWHLCARDPGAVFASLYAQLQHHVYADPVAMLMEVLRDGMMMVLDPTPGRPGTPFWCFSFDHHRYVSGFAELTPHPVFVHDFRDARPFPGWGVLDRAGVLDAVERLPGEDARNKRLGLDAVCEGHADQVLRLLTTDARRDKLRPLILDHVRHGAAAVEQYANAVSEQFAGSMEAALAEFGYAATPPEGRRACA